MGQAKLDTLYDEINTLLPSQQDEVIDFVSRLKNKKLGYRKINNETEEERVAAIHKALKSLQKMGTAEKFGDPVEWQREVRKDRLLPGRD